MTSDKDIASLNEVMSAILRELQLCKDEVDDILINSEWDEGAVGYTINLEVTFGNLKTGVYETQEPLNLDDIT